MTEEQVEFIFNKFNLVPPGLPAVIAPPDVTMPGTSTLCIDVLDDGMSKSSVLATATLLEDAPVRIETSYEATIKSLILSDMTGRIEFTYYPGKKYLIESDALGLTRTVVAPAVGTAAEVGTLPNVP